MTKAKRMGKAVTNTYDEDTYRRHYNRDPHGAPD